MSKGTKKGLQNDDLWAKKEEDTGPIMEMENLNGDAETSKEENPERGNWSNKVEFLLSSLGFAVGLGNLWRFPYICFKNGGATFLVPYVLMFFFVGVPIFFLELFLGQFSSLGCITIWKFAPLFKGLGIAMLIVSSLLTIYYNVVLCWALFYLFASFTELPSLPWIGCGNSWNSDKCFDDRDLNSTANLTEVRLQLPNDTTGPSSEYFGNYLLEASAGIEETGYVRWQLALCLLLGWILVYFCVIKGIKSAGKVVYVTATLPYVLIIILVIRGCMLDGASEGIKFYIASANWTKLKEPGIWKEAAGQMFFSLGLSSGGLFTMASYNKFHNNVFSDAFLIPSLNCLTSVLAGFAVFPMLGHMAHELGKKVEDVATSGPGLAFDVYPEAISRLPISPLFAVVFFLTLVSLGIDSLFVTVETVITAILDESKKLARNRKFWRTAMPIVYCVGALLLGLPLVTQAGLYWVNLMDAYAVSFPMTIIGFFECLVVTYIYGVPRLFKDMKAVGGRRSDGFWMIVSIVYLIPLFIAPVIIGMVIVFYCIEYKAPTMGPYTYPDWAIILGWLMTCTSLAAFVLYIPYHLICKQTGTFRQRLVKSLRPTEDWGPALNEFRKEAGYDPLPEDAEKLTRSTKNMMSYTRPGELYLYQDTAEIAVQCDIEDY
ncbi:sodium- and chloride-dependent glycine transporter 1-like [Ptychodera flava]|uniref:sodium- and chloride-dependent glycine transporter 1-like n=1 Tax=Ptychodera flava TaxID=63121 RepID=UPI00396A6BA3